MKKVKLIYNPNSGEKKITNQLDNIIKIYQKYNYILIPYRLSKHQHISKAFLDMDETYDHLLIAGGDGTVDIVLNAMKEFNVDIPIAILPTGTANDFAKALNISLDINKAVKDILNSEPKSIDIGKINNKYFINVASAGMFTDVSQKINPELKNYMGKVSYYITGIEEALHLRKFNINVNSKEVMYKGDMYLMLVFNGKTAGNLNLAYKAEVDDGYLDVIIFKAMPIPKSIPVLISILKGEHLDTYNESEILYFKTKKVRIDCCDGLLTDIDGERGPDFPLDIECIEDGIKILGVK
ncbi:MULTISPECIES: YegS/Rv2252/BmrU family lipid kinase [Romboutsia]|uniref:Diacylglycerol kinase n=1 Tax=Romboutsia hominis TaxID=1507512 RepID=A0A2P2BR26_9FIRM|nr:MULTISPECIES: YegS/Rv2252/BmrU family lipid kinase [Romboutsia]MCH1960155.1 YegS/Rv2252/BmrU family lipid kinase [Romboutsia hominis]MCH1969410.1 YegS/Rv2252/BmrU family lipid kinase [Romboutsia hominis]MDB8790591.1 YegS/Rv2252/BmrU family lipid kinase [Romboutsia sp. 1001216sp1]MDB8801324.1 YegS/Rv2252/BmrU family lipid kinase [Romboutsia sp. 1001216sp1]MDB8804896.1 YegS/Rv2252/BmrU family lipid kinase [Romboutsia sp. 1001216sp1]